MQELEEALKINLWSGLDDYRVIIEKSKALLQALKGAEFNVTIHKHPTLPGWNIIYHEPTPIGWFASMLKPDEMKDATMYFSPKAGG
jgi:hypothetical protein